MKPILILAIVTIAGAISLNFEDIRTQDREGNKDEKCKVIKCPECATKPTNHSLVDPGKCVGHNYCTCDIDRKAKFYQCPPGNLFDESSSQCEIARAVTCPPPTMSAKLIDFRAPNKDEKCKDIKCPRCSPVPTNHSLPDGDGKCTGRNYCTCDETGNKVTFYQCAPTELFDPNSKMCNESKNVKCPGSTSLGGEMINLLYKLVPN